MVSVLVTQDVQYDLGSLHYAYLRPFEPSSYNLACFALWTAFLSSLAGHDPGDYYQASVTMGLAPCR